MIRWFSLSLHSLTLLIKRVNVSTVTSIPPIVDLLLTLPSLYSLYGFSAVVSVCVNVLSASQTLPTKFQMEVVLRMFHAVDEMTAEGRGGREERDIGEERRRIVENVLRHPLVTVILRGSAFSLRSLLFLLLFFTSSV